MRRFLATVFCVAALATTAFGQDDHKDASPVSVGYAVVTPTAGVGLNGITGGLVVFETLGYRSQVPALQTGLLPATLTTRMNLFASANIRVSRSVGVGITNPGATDASVTMTLRGASGSLMATRIVTVSSGQQVSSFVSEYFAGVANIPPNFDGTMTITSNTPVGIMALMFNGRTFTTIPVTSLSATVATPQVNVVAGGPNSVLLPQFVADGGWATEIVVLNNGSTPLTVRIDLFKQDGTPLITTLNHQLGSSFVNLVIAPGGIIMFAPRNANGDSDF